MSMMNSAFFSWTKKASTNLSPKFPAVSPPPRFVPFNGSRCFTYYHGVIETSKRFARKVTLHAEEQQRQITKVLERVEAYASQAGVTCGGGVGCYEGYLPMGKEKWSYYVVSPINGHKRYDGELGGYFTPMSGSYGPLFF